MKHIVGASAHTMLIHVLYACIGIPAVVLNHSEQLPILYHLCFTLKHRSNTIRILSPILSPDTIRDLDIGCVLEFIMLVHTNSHMMAADS